MLLIAETAWHHDGDFEFFKKLVEEIAKNTEADYIKFHITLDINEYMHTDHPAYQWAKERIFKKEQWYEILNISLKNNKKLMLLFNDKKAIDFGMSFNPEIVEIHSVCLNDIKLLKHLKEKIRPETKIVLGVGGSDLYEIENVINFLGSNMIVLMHGFQNFPTKYEDVNFAKTKKIMQLFPYFEHGYADHTAWDNENNILITLFGAALGMSYIEKHVTIELGKERCDWNSAISIEMFNDLTIKLEVLSQTFGNGLLSLNEGEKSYSTFGANKKAAILNKNIKKGHKLSFEDFTFKRTGQSSDLSQIDTLENIGKTFSITLEKGHCIVKSDLA